MTKLLLTFREAADSVPMSECKIKKMVAEDRFPKPVRIGGNIRFRMSDLEQWTNELAEGNVPPPPTKRGRPRLAV